MLRLVLHYTVSVQSLKKTHISYEALLQRDILFADFQKNTHFYDQLCNP